MTLQQRGLGGRADAFFDCDKGILWAKGACIGKIRILEKGEEMDYDTDIRSALSSICSWHRLVSLHTMYTPKTVDSFIRTIICEVNNPDDSRVARTHRELRDILGLLVEGCRIFCPRSLDTLMLDSLPYDEFQWEFNWDIDTIREWTIEIARHLFRQKFFLSTSGLIGLGPDTLQEGDIICVL